jgi:hypothetical protein
MKNVKNQMVKAILLSSLAITSMIGCADNKGGSNGVRGAVTPQALNQGTYGTVTATQNVNTDIVNLLGGVIQQGQLGAINPNNGVYMMGHVAFPNGSTLDPMQSYLILQIYDAMAMQDPNKAIVMSIGRNSTSQGQVQSVGSGIQATIRFADQLGSITVTGSAPYVSGTSLKGGNFTGTITYVMSSGVQGTLGQFQIPTCAFFACL